jgi:DNA processing protein
MSPYGRKAAHRLASELADLGFTIVSGLAAGVDSVAHTAALDVGGSTVAVLACGLDVVYPPENGQLQAAIAASGTLVSEYPSGTPAVAGRFPARNRIIAGLSVGVVVVEAGQRSGALITAERAIDYDRKVMAVPGSIFHPGARGCHWLLESGQAPALASRQVAAYLGFSPLGTGTEAGRGGAAGSRDAWPGSLEAGSPEGLAAVARAGGPSPEQRILALLRSGPLQADEIVDALELGVSESAVALTHLEIAGLAELAPDGRWHTAV